MARFVVLRVNGDPADTYASPVQVPRTDRGTRPFGALHATWDAINRALALAMPDHGTPVEWTTVEAPDAGAARVIGWTRVLGTLIVQNGDGDDEVAPWPELEAPDAAIRFPFGDSAFVVTPVLRPGMWEGGRYYGPHYLFDVGAESGRLLNDEGRRRQADQSGRDGNLGRSVPSFVRFVVPDKYPRVRSSLSFKRWAADWYEGFYAGGKAGIEQALVAWAHEYEQARVIGEGTSLTQADVDALARAFPEDWTDRIEADGVRLQADVARARRARSGWIY